MNWFTLSLIIGIISVIIGIILLVTDDIVASIVAFAIGAGFLAFDLNPTTSVKSEFSGLKKEEMIKKLLGVIILIVALVLFIIEVGKTTGIF